MAYLRIFYLPPGHIFHLRVKPSDFLLCSFFRSPPSACSNCWRERLLRSCPRSVFALNSFSGVSPPWEWRCSRLLFFYTRIHFKWNFGISAGIRIFSLKWWVEQIIWDHHYLMWVKIFLWWKTSRSFLRYLLRV